MYQSLDAFIQLDECSVVGNAYHLTFDHRISREPFFHFFPRMRLKLLISQRDTIRFSVIVQNNDFYLLVHRYDLRGMINPSPRQIGYVKQTVYSSKIDEHAEVCYILDSARHHMTGFDTGENLMPFLLKVFFYQFPSGNNNILSRFIKLYDLELISITNVFVKILNWLNVYLRAG